LLALLCFFVLLLIASELHPADTSHSRDTQTNVGCYIRTEGGEYSLVSVFFFLRADLMHLLVFRCSNSCSGSLNVSDVRFFCVFFHEFAAARSFSSFFCQLHSVLLASDLGDCDSFAVCAFRLRLSIAFFFTIARRLFPG